MTGNLLETGDFNEILEEACLILVWKQLCKNIP